MTVAIKSGVPGSGKTQSMVAELLAFVALEKKSGNHRPIYTNITGLDQAQIPHVIMRDMPPPTVPFVREEGVMYTIDWMECPPNSIVVIDEAQKNGYKMESTQKAVPLYISELAVHRKDYSLDIWFITQAANLLHTMCRRQCGLHQHYERKFGFKRAFVFEWHECQDRITSKKNAVISQFVFKDKYQKAYFSAEVHTKTKFKVPLWIWVPILVIPLGVYALPRAYGALSGAMTGKGVGRDHSAETVQSVVENGVIVKRAVSAPVALPAPLSAVPAASAAQAPSLGIPATVAVVPVPVVAGCIATPVKCVCVDLAGQDVLVASGVCMAKILGNSSPGQKADITHLFPDGPAKSNPDDNEVLAYLLKAKRPSY